MAVLTANTSILQGFYKPEENVFCNDGRENQLLDFITTHPQLSSIRNSPEAVLAAVDEFARTKDFLMNVGPYKGSIITDIIATERPSSILEIGGYIGYSAIMFGNAMRNTGVPAPRYVSLEMNPKFASVSRALVELAGLSDVVEIQEGPCRASLHRLAADTSNQGPSSKKWDMLFLDHSKISYLNDLKLAEELGIVAPGSIVIADDMKRPGNPMYSDYVRADTATKAEAYMPFVGCLSDGGISLGNPYLVYQTTLLEGLEPTGHMDAVEISRCVDLVDKN
ncbi:probable catechol O-methyltransferase 2 [Aspergillus lentulus]|uniref:catechol O-methyltransferase n=1 Tax=Aspergillus lentulus TaxID=293939 RepID=A0AAN4TB35_ASPLE|nr:probable catechol O-methyltransferase 2 [Aspergillus lentulus]